MQELTFLKRLTKLVIFLILIQMTVMFSTSPVLKHQNILMKIFMVNMKKLPAGLWVILILTLRGSGECVSQEIRLAAHSQQFLN